MAITVVRQDGPDGDRGIGFGAAMAREIGILPAILWNMSYGGLHFMATADLRHKPDDLFIYTDKNGIRYEETKTDSLMRMSGWLWSEEEVWAAVDVLVQNKYWFEKVIDGTRCHSLYYSTEEESDKCPKAAPTAPTPKSRSSRRSTKPVV